MLRGQCQISVGSCVFPGVFYEAPEILGTLLQIRQTRRSRYAPLLQMNRSSLPQIYTFQVQKLQPGETPTDWPSR